MKTINLNDMMPEMQFSFEDRDYILRCNLCVYEAVSNQCGGDLMTLYDEQKPFDGVLTWLAAMLNDYAEEQDWPDFVPYTAKQLSKKFSPRDRGLLGDVMNLVTESLTGKKLNEIPDPEDQGAESDV